MSTPDRDLSRALFGALVIGGIQAAAVAALDGIMKPDPLREALGLVTGK